MCRGEPCWKAPAAASELLPAASGLHQLGDPKKAAGVGGGVRGGVGGWVEGCRGGDQGREGGGTLGIIAKHYYR